MKTSELENREYKYGFTTDIEVEEFPKGQTGGALKAHHLRVNRSLYLWLFWRRKAPGSVPPISNR